MELRMQQQFLNVVTLNTNNYSNMNHYLLLIMERNIN